MHGTLQTLRSLNPIGIGKASHVRNLLGSTDPEIIPVNQCLLKLNTLFRSNVTGRLPGTECEGHDGNWIIGWRSCWLITLETLQYRAELLRVFGRILHDV
ncbi:MAG: hypothetical protein CMJ39_04285 [Phycisphaerae bacterium]|nr:hypothetical protein [Phycisphaerae bacterium]